ncbi:MAG: RNA polymerase sigma factor [Planctomycetaceae bacterium]
MHEPLLPRIAAGDRSAVTVFLSRFGGLVWALASRRFGRREDVEDAVQEVFVELWRSERDDACVRERMTNASRWSGGGPGRGRAGSRT